MRQAHAHMTLTDDYFSTVATHLVNTFKELNVPQNMIDGVVGIALSVKDDVLSE